MSSIDKQLDSFDGSRSLDRAQSLPSLWYSSSEAYYREQRFVFLRSWQMVGRIEQLKEAGSFITADIAGEPVVIARDKSGTLSAFSNVCRHKAARVVLPTEGQASFFQCRYHGWTYDLSGRLKGTPECDGIKEFEKEKNCLPKWEVDSWGPLVFVHYGKSQQALSEFLSPLPVQTKDLGIEKLKFVERRTYSIDCNWKVFVDNYLDGGYHINTIHPALAGVIDYSTYRTEVFKNSSVQISPLKSSQSDAGQVRSGTCAYYWHVFPNLMINIYDGVLDTNLVLPISPNKCLVHFDFYFTNTQGKEAQDYIKKSMQVADQVQQEDLQICEDVQRGLNSQTYDVGRFSPRREMAAYAFHQSLYKAATAERFLPSI